MPTLFFEDTDPHQKIRFDTFGHSNTMKPVRTKAINDIRFLTPPHADFDARRPAYREDEQYEENKVDPLIFTHQQKMSLRNATALALKIVDDGYQAMYNYLRFKHDPDNAHVVYFKKRVKAWFGSNSTKILGIIITHMREMQNKLQDPKTFITFVNAKNQRFINCDNYYDGRKGKSCDNYYDGRNGKPDVGIDKRSFFNYRLTPVNSSGIGFAVYKFGFQSRGMRIYVALIWSETFNCMVMSLIHELSHKILMTSDSFEGGQGIYGAQACKALAAKDPDQAVTIADNWAMFYMSFGCYPGQEEYAYQAGYDIEACDIDPKRSRILNKFNISTKCQTIEELEELDAIARRNEPAQVSELRAYNAHIARRRYLETFADVVKIERFAAEIVERKRLKDVRQKKKADLCLEITAVKLRMERRESLTNLAPKTAEEVNELNNLLKADNKRKSDLLLSKSRSVMYNMYKRT